VGRSGRITAHAEVSTSTYDLTATHSVRSVPAVYRKAHHVTLILPSDSIRGTLFTIHEADQVAAYCNMPSISRFQRRADPYHY
jgi:hypothetical protein